MIAIGFLLLCLSCMAPFVQGNCKFPPYLLEIRGWQLYYQGTFSSIAFKENSMIGLTYFGIGNPITTFDCILQKNDFYVFRGAESFTEGGQDRYLYLCMRLVQETNFKYHMYMLPDLDNRVTFREQSARVKVFTYDNDASDDTCSFCRYTEKAPELSDVGLIVHPDLNTDLTVPSPFVPCDCEEESCSVDPTAAPTEAPTAAPTQAPTAAPTESPTIAPTAAPTDAPTAAPTDAPTAAPTDAPTAAPTDAPTAAPTDAPTAAPTDAPTNAPTAAPTETPRTQCELCKDDCNDEKAKKISKCLKKCEKTACKTKRKGKGNGKGKGKGKAKGNE